jgi:hypothetical protein
MSTNPVSDETHLDFDYKAMMEVWNLSKDKHPDFLRKQRDQAESESCLQNREEASQGFWTRLVAFVSGRAGHEFCDD